jgi:hypothetical protein
MKPEYSLQCSQKPEVEAANIQRYSQANVKREESKVNFIGQKRCSDVVMITSLRSGGPAEAERWLWFMMKMMLTVFGEEQYLPSHLNWCRFPKEYCMKDRKKNRSSAPDCCVMPHKMVPVSERMANSKSFYRPGVAKMCHKRSICSAKELNWSGAMFSYYEWYRFLWTVTLSYIVYEKYCEVVCVWL